MTAGPDIFISVDVETAGPQPGEHALLSIGACLIADLSQTFYVELQPDHQAAVPEALAIGKLSLSDLAERGVPPAEAMAQFAAFLSAQAAPGGRPVFVAFNAPFDWMFVAHYFQRYLGDNPFGHSALDMKAFYMGLTGVRWSETGLRHAAARYHWHQELTHNALADALYQAALFREMLAEARQRGWPWLEPFLEATHDHRSTDDPG